MVNFSTASFTPFKKDQTSARSPELGGVFLYIFEKFHGQKGGELKEMNQKLDFQAWKPRVFLQNMKFPHGKTKVFNFWPDHDF